MLELPARAIWVCAQGLFCSVRCDRVASETALEYVDAVCHVETGKAVQRERQRGLREETLEEEALAVSSHTWQEVREGVSNARFSSSGCWRLDFACANHDEIQQHFT